MSSITSGNIASRRFVGAYRSVSGSLPRSTASTASDARLPKVPESRSDTQPAWQLRPGAVVLFPHGFRISLHFVQALVEGRTETFLGDRGSFGERTENCLVEVPLRLVEIDPNQRCRLRRLGHVDSHPGSAWAAIAEDGQRIHDLPPLTGLGSTDGEVWPSASCQEVRGSSGNFPVGGCRSQRGEHIAPQNRTETKNGWSALIEYSTYGSETTTHHRSPRGRLGRPLTRKGAGLASARRQSPSES